MADIRPNVDVRPDVDPRQGRFTPPPFVAPTPAPASIESLIRGVEPKTIPVKDPSLEQAPVRPAPQQSSGPREIKAEPEPKTMTPSQPDEKPPVGLVNEPNTKQDARPPAWDGLATARQFDTAAQDLGLGGRLLTASEIRKVEARLEQNMTQGPRGSEMPAIAEEKAYRAQQEAEAGYRKRFDEEVAAKVATQGPRGSEMPAIAEEKAYRAQRAAEAKATPVVPVAPEVEVIKPEVLHPLYVRPPGLDSMDHVDPGPDATSLGLPTNRIFASVDAQKESAIAQAGSSRTGSAFQEEILGDPRVRIEEISASTGMLIEAWREPTSFIRTIMTQLEPGIDQDAMLKDYSVAVDAMMTLFNNHTIIGLVEKTVNDEATTHTRVVRAHTTPGTWVNSAIAKMFNADFDGDELKISFDPEAIAGAKDAIAYLIGTEGDLKIDPGFFAMHPMAGGFDGVKAQLKSMFSDLNPTDVQLKGLALAIETSWKSGNAEVGLASVVRWARAIALNPGRPGSESWAVGEILQRIYDMNSEILKTSLIVRGVADAYGIIPQLADSPAVDPPRLRIDFPQSTTPEPAANMQDAGTALNTPRGMVPNRNMAFRVSAGWQKMVRLSKLIFNKNAVDRRTFLHLLALQMSGMSDFDDSARAISQIARTAVANKVGYPKCESDQAFVRWLHDFVAAYNDSAFIINSAAVQVKLDKTVAPSDRFHMTAIPTETDSDDKKDRTRKAIRDIYGNVRMIELFGDKCPAGYKYITLDEFINTNKMDLATLGSPSDKFTNVDMFIGRLADLRTSFAKKIDTELKGAWQKGGTRAPGALANQLVSIGVDGKQMTRLAAVFMQRILAESFDDKTGPRKFIQEMEILVEALHFFGQEMFTYLGLDNPAGYQVTALGRKFVAATSEDGLLGVLYEAIASYRFAPVKKLRELYDAAVEAGDIDAMEDYSEKYEAQLAEIGSSSDTWGAIVRAYLSGKRFEGEEGDPDNGKDILDFIFFSDHGGQTIEERLNVLVREDPLGRPEQQIWEIAADLYANPKSMYAKNRWISDFGHGQLLSDLKAASDKIDAYGEVNWSACVKGVAEAKARHHGNMKQFLKIVGKSDRVLVGFKPWMMTDAILTVMEKSAASGEKGSQERAGASIYASVCYLVNGGVWSDMFFGGDASVGKISLERFWKSPRFLAKLLSDPSYSITVYDETGEVTLTMEEILGSTNPDEDVIWKWLEENPRAAMALRMSAQRNGVGKAGSSKTIATNSLTETMTDVLEGQGKRSYVNDVAVKAFADKPGFYALVSLTVNMTGMRRFQLRDEMTANVYKTIRFIRGLNSDGPASQATVDNAVDKLFLSAFGAERIANINKMYAEGMVQNAIEKTGKTIADADDVRPDEDYQLGQIRASMKADIFNYATMLAKPGSGVPKMSRMSSADVAKLFKLKDESTQRAYFDVIQTISNVKTALSTAVNGSESRFMASLMFLSYITPEPCEAKGYKAELPYLEFGKKWTDFIGLQAFLSDGRWAPVNEVNWQEIGAEAAKRDGIVRIEDPALCTSPTCACKRHATADQSTNYGGRQTPAFVRLLTIVRTLSAEKLNLKSKTQGNDGSDSVVKNFLFEGVSAKVVDKINLEYQRVFKETAGDKMLAMAAARIVLAAHLDKVYRSMRYSDEISMSDYVNVAQIMIREMDLGGDVPQLKVLAMGQLNSLVKKVLQDTRCANPKAKQQDYVDATTALLTDLEKIGGVLDVDTIMSGFKVHRQKFLGAEIISQRESSPTRNIELITQIIDETGVKSISDVELDEFESELSGDFRGVFKKWQKYAGKRPEGWEAGSERRYTYRIIGVWAGAKRAVEAVGPRNAYIVYNDHPEAVKAIVRAYELGVNVLLDGELTAQQWKAIRSKVGIDKNQGAKVKDNLGNTLGTLIPMFDLRLNGRNTVLNEGGFNAGNFWADPVGNLVYYFESIINEHGAGDGGFVRTKVTDNIQHNKPGEYRYKASIAFANLLAHVESLDEEAEPGARIPQGRGDIRLVIFGSAGFNNYDTLKKAIEGTRMYKEGLIAEVISGTDPGAHRLGERWAREYGVPIKPMPAAWDDVSMFPEGKAPLNDYGKPYNPKAGEVRNVQMAEYATRGLGFWDGESKDTKGMRSILRSQGKDVMFVYTANGQVEVNGKITNNLGNAPERVIRERGIPECTVGTPFDVMMDILDPYREGRLQDAHIDLGIPVVNEIEHKRLDEGIRTYMARVDRGELDPETGLLPTARRGEIIGFMRAEIGDQVWYHPIRPFESGHAPGAPTDMRILSANFDPATGDIVIKWVLEGTMANRFFKVFEDGSSSNKFMANAESVDDIELEDGTQTWGYISQLSTETRRLLQRRQQKMLTLIYKARTDPWGYNLAEIDGVLVKEPKLRAAVLTGKTKIGLWKSRLKQGPIDFIADAELNTMLNYMAERCVRYGIDPTIMFASHHGKIPNYQWFNYQLLLKTNRTYLNSLMRLMHLMNPSLCPDGLDDASGAKTFFDRNLQVLRPVRDTDGSLLGYERVDLYGGWHFLDDHYYGHSGSGTTVSTYNVPSLPKLMAGGKNLPDKMLNLVLDWAGVDQAATPSRILSDDTPDAF